jgi:hypothetical protein
VPISLVQQGMCTELEFIKYVVLGSDGQVEVSRPATDDDRRDADVHRRGDFDFGLGFQIKSAEGVEHPWAADRLHIRFTVRKDRLITHPNFWYFLSFLDLRIQGIASPVFIVPSAEIHEHAIPHLHGDTWHFDFHASLGPNAHDHWVRYRVNTLDIGKRILSIIEELENRKASSSPPLGAGRVLNPLLYPPDLLWLRKRNAAA